MKKLFSLRAIPSFLTAIALIAGGLPVNAQQEQDVQEIEKLLKTKISTVTKSERLTSDAPASVTIITTDEIERYGFRTLEEAFLTVAGFYTTNDRNYAYLGTRGFSRPTDYNDRIRILIDGHILNESMFGQGPIGTDLALDLGAFDQIEIIRGPHSALYGTGAMFSVINFVTKKGNDVNGVRFSFEAGVPGRLRASLVAGKRLKSGTDIFFSAQGTDEKGEDLYFKEYDDPGSHWGVAYNLDRDRSAGFQLRVSQGSLVGQAVFFTRSKGFPTGAWNGRFNDQRANTSDQNAFLDVTYDHDLSTNTNLLVRASTSRNDYWGQYPHDEFVSHERTVSSRTSGEIQFRWDLTSNNRFIAGVELQDHARADLKIWADTKAYFDGNFPFRVYSFYLQDEIQIRSNMAVTFGLRRDEYSSTEGKTTPRLAFVYHPFESGALKLIYGESFRAPTPYELNYADVFTGYKSSPFLKPEQIQTAEIVWEQRLGKNIYATVSLFDDRLENLIDQRLDPADDLVHFVNVGRVSAYGLEMGIQGRWQSGLWAHANYTFERAEDEDTGLKLTNSPAHLIKAGLSVPLFRYVMASVFGTYESGRKTVYGTETDPYLLLNGSLSTIHLFDRIRLSLIVKNLLNAKYFLPGGFEHRQPAIIQPSRSVAVKIEFTF